MYVFEFRRNLEEMTIFRVKSQFSSSRFRFVALLYLPHYCCARCHLSPPTFHPVSVVTRGCNPVTLRLPVVKLHTISYSLQDQQMHYDLVHLLRSQQLTMVANGYYVYIYRHAYTCSGRILFVVNPKHSSDCSVSMLSCSWNEIINEYCFFVIGWSAWVTFLRTLSDYLCICVYVYWCLEKYYHYQIELCDLGIPCCTMYVYVCMLVCLLSYGATFNFLTLWIIPCVSRF